MLLLQNGLFFIWNNLKAFCNLVAVKRYKNNSEGGVTFTQLKLTLVAQFSQTKTLQKSCFQASYIPISQVKRQNGHYVSV